MAADPRHAAAHGQPHSDTSLSDSSDASSRWVVFVQQLLVCGRTLRQSLSTQLREWDINDGEFLLLFWAAQPPGPKNQAELAELIGISPAKVSSLVETMRQRGLVLVTRSEQDRRRQLLTVTSTGQRLLATMLNAIEPWAEQLASVVNVDGVDPLTIMQRLAEGTAQAPPARSSAVPQRRTA